MTPKADTESGISRVPVNVDGRFSKIVPIVMVFFMVLGLFVILANYIVVGFGAPSNWYLLGGLGFILIGIVAATQWR